MIRALVTATRVAGLSYSLLSSVVLIGFLLHGLAKRASKKQS
jgi:tetrahydromethanopterin S-methyltransferase subunit F